MPASGEVPSLPPFVEAALDADGRLLAPAAADDTYILQALGQQAWYRRLLAHPAPRSVAISTVTLRVGGAWGARGTPEEAVRACGGEEAGCRVYLDRDRVVWRPAPSDPVPAALVPEPGVDTDTATRSGALQGSVARRPTCLPEESRIWAETAAATACLRYRLGGRADADRPVLLLLDGDTVFPLYAQDRPQIVGVAAVGALSAKRDALLERHLAGIAAARGLRYLLLARPGTGGSSGSQWRQGKSLQEAALVVAALDALAERHGITSWTIAGQSGGAAIAASLLTARRDVACAVLASGPLSLKDQLAAQGADPALLNGLYDPLQHVGMLVPDPRRRVIVLSDRRDRLVPLGVQAAWVAAARARGATVEHRAGDGWGQGPLHHDLTWPAVELAASCGEVDAGPSLAARALP